MNIGRHLFKLVDVDEFVGVEQAQAPDDQGAAAGAIDLGALGLWQFFEPGRFGKARFGSGEIVAGDSEFFLSGGATKR